MTADLERPRRILAVADTSPEQTALRSALALADAHDATVEVLACVEPPHDLVILARLAGEDPADLIATAGAHLGDETSATLSRIAPDREIAVEVVTGKAYFEIIRHVDRTGCDFVIKRAEPLTGLQRFLFASTDQHLLRKCPCPVWLQTPASPVTGKRILAAVDLDLSDAAEPETLAALNRRVVETARRVATAPDAEITVLHAWDAVGEGMIWAFSGQGDARVSAQRYLNEIHGARQADMTRFVAEMARDIPPGARLVPRLARGAPDITIPAISREIGADMVVMGTVARTGLSGVFIGNTAENIINTLECPVLAVKPDGFVSPLLAGG